MQMQIPTLMRSVCKLMLVVLGVGMLGNHAWAQESTIQGVDPEFAALIARCAPTVHPETMASVISAESRGHQFAIADAGPVNLPWAKRKLLVRSLYPSSLDMAVAQAEALISRGHTVSLGLAQVNDRNLRSFGLTVRDVFEPCTNLATGGKILTAFYEKAAKKFGDGQRALNAALSAYNSGDWVRGARDGYVSLVYKQLGRPLAMRTTPALNASKSAQKKEASGWHVTVHPLQAEQREFAMKVSDFVVAK